MFNMTLEGKYVSDAFKFSLLLLNQGKELQGCTDNIRRL